MKREFVCRGAEVKWRLFVLHTFTCGVTLHLSRNKLAARGKGGPGGEGPVGGLPPPRPGPGAVPLSGGFSAVRRGKKVEFYCRFAGRKTALFLPISDNYDLSTISYASKSGVCDSNRHSSIIVINQILQFLRKKAAMPSFCTLLISWLI